MFTVTNLLPNTKIFWCGDGRWSEHVDEAKQYDNIHMAQARAYVVGGIVELSYLRT